MSRKTQKPLPKFEVGTSIARHANCLSFTHNFTCVMTIGDDYRILHGLGEGAYGTVAAALHIPTGREVAIKKVLPFEHTLFCLRTLRELKLLRFFSESCVNENVSLSSPIVTLYVELSLTTVCCHRSLASWTSSNRHHWMTSRRSIVCI